MPLIKEATSIASIFTQTKAFQKLSALAENACNLSHEGILTPQRLSKFVAEGGGYKLLYGTERIDEETIQALTELAEETKAVEKMEQMQGGERLNFIKDQPSENRPALHTATRDFFNHPNQKKAALEAAEMAKGEVDKLRSFFQQVDQEKKFKTLIVIGIGGSELGPKVIYEALLYLLIPQRQVHFIGNLDPDNSALTLRGIDLKETLVLVMSKSGSTLETSCNEALVQSHFKQAGVDPKDHFIAITTKGSPLDNQKKYLNIFYIWDWVGGRFSSTSSVGGAILAFAFGFEVFWEFLRGANAMDKVALKKEPIKNIPLLAALLAIWNRNFLDYPLSAIIPYSQALARLPAHIQQVDMESNGKQITKEGVFVDFHTGPILFGEPGTNAQHSFYQLFHQGTTIVPLVLIGFKQSQTGQDTMLSGTTSQEKLLANLFAQSIALAAGQREKNPNKFFQGNRPNHLLLGRQLTPFSLGSLLAFFEHKVAFEGFIWNINSFDQEGVQLGKRLADKIIQRFAVQNGQNSENSPAYPLGDAYLKQLETL